MFSTNIINWKYFGIIFLKIGNGQVGMLLLYYSILINEMNIQNVYKSMKKKKNKISLYKCHRKYISVIVLSYIIA